MMFSMNEVDESSENWRGNGRGKPLDSAEEWPDYSGFS